MCHTNYSYDMIGQGSKDDESRSMTWSENLFQSRGNVIATFVSDS